MKNVFIDTNILMDIFADHRPLLANSLRIYTLGIERKIKLFTTSNTITTLHYLLKKIISEEKTRMALEEVVKNIFIIQIDNEIIKKSLKSFHKNFEYAIQINAAQSINTMNYIVTRDLKEFKNPEIKVFTPDEFLNTL